MSRTYQSAHRRMLVDMHIPDWDPGFLARYDPAEMARNFDRAHVSAVMLYCKSHLGLCYWPTRAGRMHGGIGGRDMVGELCTELRARKLGVCAYYSIVFDNWAVQTHPEWAQRPISGANPFELSRYGICCQNNPEYRAYEMAQLGDLLSRYQFDAMFLDMIFWPMICGCDHCRERFRREAGKEIPKIVDWTSPDWCEFQTARERWSSELTRDLMARARELCPAIALTHNLAPALSNWVLAQPISASIHDTFVAGDLYGDRIEQLFVSKLLLHLSETRPAEFMTSVCSDLSDHVRVKSEPQMRAQAMAACATSSAFLFIDAIDPSGTVNPDVYDRVGQVFTETEPYERFIGGDPIEDVAVYFSGDSQMDFAENGTAAASVAGSSARYPHLAAVRGACRALQRAQIPFGVITRRQLAELSRFRVLVMPNVLRMDGEEAGAIRDYVRGGGRLYASRYTSLVETAGRRRDNFMLEEIFGASYLAEEEGAFVYLKPAENRAAEIIAPQKFISCRISHGTPAKPLCGMPRLHPNFAARSLFTLSVPYGYPARGTVADHRWASIHSSPPWTDLPNPAIVENDFGGGRAIYSAASIEALEGEAVANLFVNIIRNLLDNNLSFTADTHPAVWMNAFHQREHGRVMISLLNFQEDLPPAPVPARIAVRSPAGKRFTSLNLAPSGNSLEFTLGSDGVLRAELDSVGLLTILLANYE